MIGDQPPTVASAGGAACCCLLAAERSTTLATETPVSSSARQPSASSPVRCAMRPSARCARGGTGSRWHTPRTSAAASSTRSCTTSGSAALSCDVYERARAAANAAASTTPSIAARASSASSSARASASARCASAPSASRLPDSMARAHAHSSGPSLWWRRARTGECVHSQLISATACGGSASSTAAWRSSASECRCTHCAATSRPTRARPSLPHTYALSRTKAPMHARSAADGAGSTSARCVPSAHTRSVIPTANTSRVRAFDGSHSFGCHGLPR
mmetsp:Transcript_18759/g.48329  ORF Transcript_18759/g.48329 Transcript_18759/m.48329 type:complete len:276 (-) Transcript_18759:187-1014(-)